MSTATRREPATLRTDLRGLALVGLAISMALYAEHSLWIRPDAADYTETVFLFAFDLPQAVLLVLWVRTGGWQRLVEVARRHPVARAAALVTAATAIISSVAHPSWRAPDLLLRAVAAIAVVDGFHQSGETWRRRVLAAIVGVCAFEAFLGSLQSIRRGTLGIGPLEFPQLGFGFGSDAGGQGAFSHPYVLAAFLLLGLGAALVLARVAPRDPALLVGAAVIGFGIAHTFSRTAILGLGAAAVVTLVARSTRPASLVLWVALAGLALGIASSLGGWNDRATTTTTASTVDTGRRERWVEAIRLIKSSPVDGVGVGRYTTELRDHPHKQLVHSHDVLLQEAAELGVVGGVAVAVLLALGAAWVIRAGPGAWAVACLYAPFWVIDALPVVSAVGIAITAVWLGIMASGPTSADPATPRRGALASAR